MRAKARELAEEKKRKQDLFNACQLHFILFSILFYFISFSFYFYVLRETQLANWQQKQNKTIQTAKVKRGSFSRFAFFSHSGLLWLWLSASVLATLNHFKN